MDRAVWLCLLILLTSGVVADENLHCEYWLYSKSVNQCERDNREEYKIIYKFVDLAHKLEMYFTKKTVHLLIKMNCNIQNYNNYLVRSVLRSKSVGSVVNQNYTSDSQIARHCSVFESKSRSATAVLTSFF